MKRSIIISVDNRARDMAANYGLHVLERNQIENLGTKINQEFATDIRIDEVRIQEFLSQFSN